MRVRSMVCAGLFGATGVAAFPAASAFAAPSSSLPGPANCVAQVTNNPDFGPPGLAHPYGITGPVVSFVAHSPGSDCYAFLDFIGG